MNRNSRQRNNNVNNRLGAPRRNRVSFQRNFRTRYMTRNQNNPNRRVSRVNLPSRKRNINNKSNKVKRTEDISINKITKKLNNLSLKVLDLDNKLFPKVTNLERKINDKKEPRIDKASTPMNMCLNTRYVSLYPTNNRFKYIPFYCRTEFTVGSDSKNFVFFPYFLPFAEYQSPAAPITITGDAVQPNLSVNRFIIYNDSGWKVATYVPIGTGCGLYGSYRIVGATIKVTNTTAWSSRAGAYTIYKTTDDDCYPLFFNSNTDVGSLNGNLQQTKNIVKFLESNKSNILVKQQFSASDVSYVNEYNIYEGNNIFQNPWEYLGSSFKSSTDNYAHWHNATGVNVKYYICFDNTNTVNRYIVETWQVAEVIPDPNSNLDIVAETQKYVYDSKVITYLRGLNPISKGK